ncbi:MAG: alpha/beta fold hydrolase [Propionivibrio sp.]
MLSIVLRLFILLELACYATFALRVLGLTPWGAALFALAALIVLRVIITSITFVFAWRYRSPAARLGVARVMRMFLEECVAFVVNFVVISPFERWWMGADRLQPASAATATTRPPLVLIHGYGCSRAAWWWHRRHLQAAGWMVATLNLEPIYTSIDNYVDPLAQRIAEVFAVTGAAQVVLVGHSMGGLVARAYLRAHGSDKVARLITLGTPHAGSQLAVAGFGENAHQMRLRSPWLEALNSTGLVVDTLTIFSPQDNYVMRQTNLTLPGARQFIIDGLGHLAMLYSSRVAGALLADLRSLATNSQG